MKCPEIDLLADWTSEQILLGNQIIHVTGENRKGKGLLVLLNSCKFSGFSSFSTFVCPSSASLVLTFSTNLQFL